MSQQPETSSRSDFLVRWIKNPIVNGVGSVVGILGFILAIYFWWDGKVEPNLIAVENSPRATVVSSAAAEKLKIFFEDELILGTVSAVQVVLWNDGKKSIRGDSILKPVVFKTEPPARIVDVVVKKETRDVLGVLIDKQNIKNGTFGLRWNILEEGDGVALQVTYIGAEDVRLSMEGVIESQGDLELLAPRKSSDKPWRVLSVIAVASVGISLFLIFIAFFTGLTGGLLETRWLGKRTATARKFYKIAKWAADKFPVAMVIGGIALVIHVVISTPPSSPF